MLSGRNIFLLKIMHRKRLLIFIRVASQFALAETYKWANFAARDLCEEKKKTLLVAWIRFKPKISKNVRQSILRVIYCSWYPRLDVNAYEVPCSGTYTRWFKYDRAYLCVNKSQSVPVIFEPPCTSKLLARSSRRHSDITRRTFSNLLKNVSNTSRHAAVGYVPISVKRRSKGKVRPATGHEGPEGE